MANILIYPIAFLAATPFFIDQLSENVFGEWMLINSYIFIALHIIGFGLPDSITAYVAQAIGAGNREKLYAYINVSARILGRMMFLTLLFGIVLFLLYLAGYMFFSDFIWKTLIIATLIISLKFPEVLFQSIFKGLERYDFSAIFNISTKLGTLILQIAVVANGFSLYSMFLGNLLVLFAVVTIQGIVIYSKMPGFKPHIFKRLPERKEIYHFGFWSWLQTIISVIAYQMDRFLIAYFLGTATVTYYVLASTIANHLHMAFVAVVSWLLPKISRLQAALEDTRTYFHTIRAFSVGFSLLVLVILYFVSEPLFTLWLGPEKYMKMMFFFKLFLVFEAFLILSIVPNLYLNATKSLSFSTGLELMYKSAIIVSMVAFFIYWKTADSLIWGQIAALILFMPVEYFLINKRILKENSLKETIFTMLPSVFISGAILANDWIWSIVFFSLGLLFYYFIYLKDKHFKRSLLTE